MTASRGCGRPCTTPAGLIAARMGGWNAHVVSVSVVTVDDQAIFRATARDVIEATEGFEPVGEADSAEAGLRLVGELAPDLVLLDVRMPGMDGIEAAPHFMAASPSSVVVLITVDDSASLPTDADTCSAAALVRKQDFGPALLRKLWAEHGTSSVRD